MEYIRNDITLRSVTQDDCKKVTKMWNMENGEISVEEATKTIEWMSTNHKRNRYRKLYHLCIAVFENKTNNIIGWCGLDNRNNDDLNHIFYIIDKAHRRRGYATQCARILLNIGFQEMELDGIYGGCARENIGSKESLRKSE